MARHSDPTNIKLLKGVDKKNPARVNKNEPVSGKLGDPPKHFKDDELVAIWHEIIGNAADGVFQSSDRVALEVATCLLYEFRQDPLSFPTMKHGKLETYLAKFGMNPVDRSKIVVPKKKNKNPFEIFEK